tara:strand:+ start:540 stop:1232 length:693 start_codon:yes stop_codon:yes gene_type:complete
MPVQPLFPVPIYMYDSHQIIDDYNNIQEELEEVCEKIKWEKLDNRPSDSHLLSPDAFSNNILRQYKCEKFIKFLDNNIKAYLAAFDNSMYSVPKEYIIDSSWLTKTNKGQHALQHTHGPTDISGVYYIKTNGEDGPLFFQDPHTDKVGNVIMDLCCSGTQSEMPLTQGLIMMWPGFMGHGTRCNPTDSTRISLSFNIMFARRGFAIKDNVDESERAYPMREEGWKDLKCY